MTEKPTSLSQIVDPSQIASSLSNNVGLKNEVPIPPPKVETVEEEPYTIKCICDYAGDDGATIYCETCDTWQHIDCFYPDNRAEAVREDFAHSCADCKPRHFNRQQANDRVSHLKRAGDDGTIDKKANKRPPSKSHKKKPPKPGDLHATTTNSIALESGKHTFINDGPPLAKKPKSSHRPSQSISSQVPKRSPSYGNSRANGPHPPSPANTPPDLPDDFEVHHYSDNFCSLYKEQDVTETRSNSFASLAIPTAMSRWLREPETMKREVGHIPHDVFRKRPVNIEESKPELNVQETTRPLDPATTLRWRFLKSSATIDKDVPIVELNGEVGFQKDYCANPDNLWADLSCPLPFVFFHPDLPLYIDTRREGSSARYVRRSCRPNAQLETYLSAQNEYYFWLVSDQGIGQDHQITLPWDFRLEKTVCSRWLKLLGLSEDDPGRKDVPEMDESEYVAISNWIDRILSEYGGCACDLENECAFVRFHRQYFRKSQVRANLGRKRQRKPRNHTVSPTSTGHATNSRAASEGHGDLTMDIDPRLDPDSSRSKPPSRERSPVRQGSFDQLGILTEPTDRDKRKVAMVEDSFRRMEQQLQPPKKKKRISDGTNTSSSSKSKLPKEGSAPASAQYVDAGTAGSKSDSPTSEDSQVMPYPAPVATSNRNSVERSRQPSASLQRSYCDASAQTDPVEGQWYSPSKTTHRKRKMIPLAIRLLNSKCRAQAAMETGSITSSMDRASSASILDALPTPTVDSTKIGASPGSQQTTSPTLSQGDIPMLDAPLMTAPRSNDGFDTLPSKVESPDLRVQLPPVPTFDNAAALAAATATPLSATGSFPPSPCQMSGTAFGPFGPSSVNGNSAHPSPVKKKLSLSDYTKSRMNKVAGKPSKGSASLKSGLSNLDELKIDVNTDAPPSDKSENASPATTTPTMNEQQI